MQIIVCKHWHLLRSSCNNAVQPKLTTCAVNSGQLVQKALRIMKLTAFFILATCLHVNAVDGYGQKVTLSEREVHIEKIFTEIKRQTGFNFLYTSNVLAGTHRVSVSVTNATVTEVLDVVLAGQGLEYRIKNDDNLVIIKTAPPLVVGIPITQSQQNGDTLVDIHGVILDENGAPASGVNVTVKGTTKGVTTNFKGEFFLKDVDRKSMIVMSSVGYDRQEMAAAASTRSIRIQLKIAVGNLDEMQVIAYGKTSRRFSTGNIATVKASDIEKQPVQNPLLALQGRVPGLYIKQENGISGGPVTIRIQGQNSIANGNEPLIVIDGIPLLSQLPRTGLDGVLGSTTLSSTPSALTYVNPSDIESIDVLKDADATAIYGSRAANGAILITTKKGKAGQDKILINALQGFGQVTRMMDMMDSRHYLDMRYEAIQNGGAVVNTLKDYDLTLWDTTRNTNWQNELIGGTEKYTNINATLSGGTNNMQYYIGTTFNKTTTVFPGNFCDKKASAYFNLTRTSSNQKLKLQLSTNYLLDDNQLPGIDLTQKAIQLEPIAPETYNLDGTLNWAPNSTGNSTWENPLIPIMYYKYKSKATSLVSNMVIDYRIMNGINFRTSLGYTSLTTNEYLAIPLHAIRPEDRLTTLRSAQYSTRSTNSWIIEPQMTYQSKNKSGMIEGLIGASLQQRLTDANSISGLGYSSDEVLKNPAAAASVKVFTPYFANYKYCGIFARLGYTLLGKYIINATARRDGSSRFGDENKFQNFGSVGIGWIFSQTKFIKNNFSFISFGKLRGSYGITGNDQVGEYSYMSLYGNISAAVPYQGVVGLTPNNLSNPFLGWEETRKWQMGLDMGLINDRLLLNITYVRNRSSNQLLNYNLATITGFSGIAGNFPAVVQNSNWEFSLSSINVKSKNVYWKADINLTISRNKLLKFQDLENSTYKYSLIVGQPLNVNRYLHFVGVNSSTGNYEVFDSQGVPTNSPNFTTDANILITTVPKFYGGFGNTFEYRDFQLDFLFQFVKQMGVNYFYNNGNVLLAPGDFSSGSSNQPTSLVDRWRKAGDIKQVQKVSTTLNTFLVMGSDAAVSDASFVRLKNLSLAYRIPQNWQKMLHLNNCKIYLQCQNLLTITKYHGLDPETQSIASLPPLRIIAFGLQVGF